MKKAFWHTSRLAKQFSDNIALILPDIDNGSDVKKISYQQLHHLVQQAKSNLIAQLPSNKLQPFNKQLVMLVAHHSINSIVFYLAALQLEWVVWWIDTELSQEKKQNLIEHYQVNFIIDEGKVTLLNATSHSLHHDLALLITTSGSTGSPNLIKLSYKNLHSNCEAICDTLVLQSDDTVISTLPLHYSFGLSIVNTHLNQGATIVLNEFGMLTREFWQTFKLHNIRCLYGVPYHYQMLLKLNLQRLSLKSLRFLAVAGGKILPEQVSQINDWCLKENKLFFVMYGQTEATARISVLAPERVKEKPYSIGQAISGGKLWLHSLELSNLRVDVGELCYSGDNVMMGTAKCLEQLALSDQKNILYTGDLASCDADGDYQIVGRLKRFIKIVGQRINLDEVEQFFNKKNITVVCSGLDDLISCYIVQSSITNKQSIDDCQKLLGQFLDVHSSYCQFFLIDEIPYLSSGKVNYPQLSQIIVDIEGAK